MTALSAPSAEQSSATSTITRNPHPPSAETSGPGSQADASVARATERSPKQRPWVVFALLGALIAGGTGYWLSQRGFEHTDDAQLDADVVAVPSRASGTVTAVHFTDNMRVSAGALLFELDSAQARAKLAQAEAELLAARALAGAADATLELTEKNSVAGKNIARASLSGATAQVRTSTDQVAELNAGLAAATATRDRARADYERAQTLVTSGAISSAELDAARSNLDNTQGLVDQAAARLVTLDSTTSQARARATEAQARFGQITETAPAQMAEAKARADQAHARISTAQAARDLAQLDLDYTRIYAPRSGVVSKRSVAVGQLVAAGQSVVVVVPDAHEPGSVWVTGNFKETQLAHMRVGQSADLSVDAYGLKLRGHVESFSGATGARFALLPPDNATGNFTKVVQRVPVRIVLDDVPKDLMLLPGLSVELSVDTRS